MNDTNTLANPGPLGLAAFGMSTILLNLHNAGLFEMNTMILSMGIFFGGITQLIVGVLEAKRNNWFGTLAFSSYGALWLTLVGLILLPKLGVGMQTSPFAMGCYLSVWGLFTLGLFVATFTMNKAMQLLFGSAVILFALLATANFTESNIAHTIAGIEGIFVGALAFYICMAELYEHMFKREILPLG